MKQYIIKISGHIRWRLYFYWRLQHSQWQAASSPWLQHVRWTGGAWTWWQDKHSGPNNAFQQDWGRVATAAARQMSSQKWLNATMHHAFCMTAQDPGRGGKTKTPNWNRLGSSHKTGTHSRLNSTPSLQWDEDYHTERRGRDEKENNNNYVWLSRNRSILPNNTTIRN